MNAVSHSSDAGRWQQLVHPGIRAGLQTTDEQVDVISEFAHRIRVRLPTSRLAIARLAAPPPSNLNGAVARASRPHTKEIYQATHRSLGMAALSHDTR